MISALRSVESLDTDQRERLWHWPGATPAIVLVHGFTGDGLDFEELAEHLPLDLWAPDLLGCGETPASADATDYDFTRYAARLTAVVRRVERATGSPPWLVGYSMGGRIALAAAVDGAPIAGLVLVGAQPGLPVSARAARLASDLALAASIDPESSAAFLARWQALPLLVTQSAQTTLFQQRRLARRARNSSFALANILSRAGPAAMPDLSGSLAGLSVPLHLVTGEMDPKFSASYDQLDRELPPGVAVRHRLPGGHAVHLEAAEALARLLRGIASP